MSRETKERELSEQEVAEIEKLLEEGRITQEEIAKKYDTSQGTVSKIGKRATRRGLESLGLTESEWDQIDRMTIREARRHLGEAYFTIKKLRSRIPAPLGEGEETARGGEGGRESAGVGTYLDEITEGVKRLTEVQVAGKQLGVSPTALMGGGSGGTDDFSDILKMEAQLTKIQMLRQARQSGQPLAIDAATGQPILSTPKLGNTLTEDKVREMLREQVRVMMLETENTRKDSEIEMLRAQLTRPVAPPKETEEQTTLSKIYEQINKLTEDLVKARTEIGETKFKAEIDQLTTTIDNLRGQIQNPVEVLNSLKAQADALGFPLGGGAPDRDVEIQKLKLEGEKSQRDFDFKKLELEQKIEKGKLETVVKEVAGPLIKRAGPIFDAAGESIEKRLREEKGAGTEGTVIHRSKDNVFTCPKCKHETPIAGIKIGEALTCEKCGVVYQRVPLGKK